MRSIVFLNQDTEARNTVLLGGSGRSGTTWVAELLNHRNGFRYMFEPLRPGKVKDCRHFNIRQYLRPGDPAPGFRPVLERIVSGRIRAWWIDKYNRKFFCRQRLIKMIRGNLLLAWLRASFPEMKIVHLLRHPGAVALSRMTLGWGAQIERVLAQEDLVSDHLAPYLNDAVEPRDPFEKHIYLWCIENLVPLRQLSPGDVHVVFYEHLCAEPEAELPALFRAAGLEFDESVAKRDTRPSRLSHRTSAVKTGEDRISRWRTKLTVAQIDRLETILGGFGLDSVYTADVMPHTQDPLALF